MPTHHTRRVGGTSGGGGTPPPDGRLTLAQREALDVTYGEGQWFPTHDRVGLLPGWTPQAAPNGQQWTHVYSTSMVTLPVGLTENTIYWCSTQPPSSSFGGATLRNCILTGQDPDTIPSQVATPDQDGWPAGTDLSSRTYLYHTGTYCLYPALGGRARVEMYDSLMDRGLWYDATMNAARAAAGVPNTAARTQNMNWQLRSTAGVHGGNFIVKRCVVRNNQDHFHLAQQGDIALDRITRIVSNIIEEPIWFDPQGDVTLHTQPEGPHSDDIQFSYTKHGKILGNWLVVGHNAGMMIQSENATHGIEDLEVAYNIFDFNPAGTSNYGVNMTNKNGEEFVGDTFHDNAFLPNPNPAKTNGGHAIVNTSLMSKWQDGTNRLATWNVVGESVTLGAAISVKNGGA